MKTKVYPKVWATTAGVLFALAVAAHATPGRGGGNANGPGGNSQCTLASATYNDAEAMSFCGQLNVTMLASVCAPYINAHLVNICRPVVDANAGAWCGVYVDQEVENRLQQRIGDISNFCGGDTDLTQIAFHLGEINARCRQSQSTSQDVVLSVEQANDVALSSSQVCEAARQECSTSVNQIVNCPDYQPLCAKWVKRRRKYFVFDPVAQKKVPVIDRVTLCAKWVKPPVVAVP